MTTTTSSPQLQDYYASERATLATESAVRETLRALGVFHVYADYDGVGDSGQFELISYVDKADCNIKTPVDAQTQKQVEDLLYALLELRHEGWENNDGAFGTFRWNLITGTLEHEHSARFTDYTTSVHEGFAAEFGEQG